ncbi:hypothetical protein BB561_005315 [Smittium simulii]|uniref:Fervidolysin-like N-terminal prodomain domain-containing protein n=1 Tax=Smittium simulii TaxID=133385 RepID=A0A2T9YAY5_9FUNG|nr:hypothetical protein BB561_005315 [Smittium simulii]
MKKFIVVFKKDIVGSLQDSTVSALQAEGAIVGDRISLINAVLVEMTDSVAESLKQNSNIDYIEEDSEVKTC